jgi:hypothetical protein
MATDLNTPNLPGASVNVEQHRATWASSFVPPKDADEAAVNTARSEHMAKFDAAVRPVDPTAISTSPANDQETARALQTLGDLNMSPAVIEHIRSNGITSISQAERDFAASWLASHKADKGWVQKYLDGDLAARRGMLSANYLLSLPVAKLSPEQEGAKRAALAAGGNFLVA